MKIPKKIKIGGFIWEVCENQDVNNEGDVFGSTHYKKQKIFIEPFGNVTEQKREQTLLHEILHVVWWQTGLNRRITEKGLDEEIIHTLSMGLYQVLKDNWKNL